jgi:hypothetical protein
MSIEVLIDDDVNSLETAQEPLYLDIESGMVLYVHEISLPTHGIFSRKFVAHATVIPGSQVNEKRKLKRRINYELKKLDRKIPRPGKPPEYKRSLEQFDPENIQDHKSMTEYKKYQYWLKNDPKLRKWNSEARRFRILWDEYYRINVNPLVRQYYRNMGNNGRELIVVFEPVVDPVTLKPRCRRNISMDSFLTPDRLPDNIVLYAVDNIDYRRVEVRK